MCMLTYYPDGTQPDVTALLNGAEMNADGHGFAIVTRHARNPIVRRYLNPEAAVREFVRLRREFDDGPAMFHSRWGTAGELGLVNVHPFKIDRRTLIAHNGVLPRAMQPLKGDRRCDTRLFAEDMLRGEDLSDTKVRNQIAHMIGKGNKLVILSTRPDYAPSYIVNEDQGHWVGDTWYSNMDFTGWWRKPLIQRQDDDALDGDIELSCLYCGSLDLDHVSDVCNSCDACQDCGSIYWDGCYCYVPHKRVKAWESSADWTGVEM